MLVLSRADLERLLDPPSVIDAVEMAFREAAAGRATALPRAVLPMAESKVFLGMVSILPRRRAKSARWAPEDAVMARLAYDRAMAHGIGTEVAR